MTSRGSIQFSLRARIFPFFVISTRTDSNISVGELIETVYEPCGTPNIEPLKSKSYIKRQN